MASFNSGGAPDSPDRICPRYVFEARIRIRFERDARKLNLPGWARNLSESGVGGFVAEALNLGEMVTLEIPLSDSDKLVIPAKVVRALGTEYGFQFTALSPDQRQRIQAALKGRPVLHYSGNQS
ncbi:MAG: PilZ domain-containing protein [Terriglobales bacterium]